MKKIFEQQVSEVKIRGGTVDLEGFKYSVEVI